MAEMVILPVPWEVTVTYREGTINGPEAILKASTQVDLFQEDIIDAWKMGITMLPINDLLKSQGVQQRSIANAYDQWLEAGEPETVRNLYEKSPERINAACQKMNDWVYQHAKLYIERQHGKSGCTEVHIYLSELRGMIAYIHYLLQEEETCEKCNS